MPETQTFKIASWNAQQLTFDRVQETRQFVHDSDIDILCVQETGLRAENERKKIKNSQLPDSVRSSEWTHRITNISGF